MLARLLACISKRSLALTYTRERADQLSCCRDLLAGVQAVAVAAVLRSAHTCNSFSELEPLNLLHAAQQHETIITIIVIIVLA